jgi:hopanoid C-3 methylase HpnR
VLLRNKEVFQFWKKLGLTYMFLGIEALDEDGLKRFRKRIPLGRNFEALEFARSLGIEVAINLIADPDWDEARFAAIREWCLDVPEIVNISVNTPYPGTETFVTEQRRLESLDYRLFDIQHAVLPTRLPLDVFYRELVHTQKVLYRKHLNWRTAPGAAMAVGALLLRGQTNFLRGMMIYNKVFSRQTLLADHARPVRYAMTPPPPAAEVARADKARKLYVHAPRGRSGRAVDDATERFVEETRMGATD